MTTLNYIDLLDRAGRVASERLALIDEDSSFTHSGLAKLTSQLAHALIQRGFDPATPFAVLSPNNSLALAALIGGLRAGGAWSNINLRSGTAINADVLNRGGCRVLFFHSSVLAQVNEIAKGVQTLNTVVCIDKEVSGYPCLQQFIEGASDALVNVRLPAGGVGFQGSTGGTTGIPKITQGGQDLLSWSSLGFMTMLSDFDIDNPPVNLAVAPITHAGGFVALATLAMGGKVLTMASADLGQILLNVPKHKISLLFLPPTIVYMLMAHPQCSNTDFASLRYLIAAAAPFAPQKIAMAHEVFGPVVCQSFGQTESGFPLTFMPRSMVTAALNDPSLASRLQSIGRPTAIVSAIEIMNDEGEPLGPDELGEIVVRGPTTMYRYLNDAEGTATIQVDGWQHTGDLGYRDKDGFIYLSDRKRDLIISGGFNVFPMQVEKVLNQHPAVQDCAVIGVPDEKWGEAVKAVVELAPGQVVTADELIALCREQLDAILAPKSIDFIEQLPRSAVGKVLKRDLRKLYWRDTADKV